MTDQELFKGTAQYYFKYRVGYSPEFFNHIIKTFNLDGKGRLLDLGCGTGQLAIPLARYFKEVTGIDPEPEMIDEARKNARERKINNIEWLVDKAENISVEMGQFRLTTIGAAFHWMDQASVLEKIYSRTENGGGLVLAYDSAGSWGTKDDRSDEWQKFVRATIKKYLGEQRRAGNTLYKKPEKDFDDLVEESSFGNQETWTSSYTRTWTLDEILGFLYSTSFCSRRLLGDQVNNFETELRDGLLKINPNGTFTEEVYVEAIIARK